MGARGSKRGEVGTPPGTEAREWSDLAARWSEMRQPPAHSAPEITRRR